MEVQTTPMPLDFSLAIRGHGVRPGHGGHGGHGGHAAPPSPPASPVRSPSSTPRGATSSAFRVVTPKGKHEGEHESGY